MDTNGIEELMAVVSVGVAILLEDGESSENGGGASETGSGSGAVSI